MLWEIYRIFVPLQKIYKIKSLEFPVATAKIPWHFFLGKGAYVLNCYIGDLLWSEVQYGKFIIHPWFWMVHWITLHLNTFVPDSAIEHLLSQQWSAKRYLHLKKFPNRGRLTPRNQERHSIDIKCKPQSCCGCQEFLIRRTLFRAYKLIHPLALQV